MKHLTHLMYRTIVSMVHDMINNQDYGFEKHEYIEWLKKVREASEVLEFNAAQKIAELREREEGAMTDKIDFTPRGFAIIEMVDSNGEDFRLQDSSAAEDNFVWIFSGTSESGCAIHMNKDIAARVATHLKRFSETGSIYSLELEKIDDEKTEEKE